MLKDTSWFDLILINYNLDIYVFFQSTDIVDAVVLHADGDREDAKEFITNMKREFPDLDLSITTFENLLPGRRLLESAAILFKSCRFLFVFVTQNFVDSDLPRFVSEILLIETITVQDRKNRLIPVSTNSNGYIHELSSVIPLNYKRYLQAISEQKSDSSFLNTFETLITDGRSKYLVNWCIIKKNIIYQWHYMHQIVIKITCQVC